jgi:hypothetical protein
MPVDITATFQRKLEACLSLRTANRAYATHVKQRLEMIGKPSPLLAAITDASIDALARAWLEELGVTIGKKHGFTYGEEFNYHGLAPGETRPLAPWIMERAKPRP